MNDLVPGSTPGGRTPPLATGQYVKRVRDGAIFQYQGLSYNMAEGQTQSALSGLFKVIWPNSVVPYAHMQFHEFLRRCQQQEFILVTRNEAGEFVALPNA